MDLDVNWLAVLVATIAHQALGALWYGVIFRSTWLKAMGMTQEEMEAAGEGAGAGFAFGALASLVSVLALAMILNAFADPSVTDGILLGAVAGIGFVTAATFMNGVYEQKKLILTEMFGAYYTLGLVAAGAILGAWR
jgi:hypothetical protein